MIGAPRGPPQADRVVLGHGGERGGDGAEVADKAAVEIGKP